MRHNCVWCAGTVSYLWNTYVSYECVLYTIVYDARELCHICDIDMFRMNVCYTQLCMMRWSCVIYMILICFIWMCVICVIHNCVWCAGTVSCIWHRCGSYECVWYVWYSIVYDALKLCHTYDIHMFVICIIHNCVDALEMCHIYDIDMWYTYVCYMYIAQLCMMCLKCVKFVI